MRSENQNFRMTGSIILGHLIDAVSQEVPLALSPKTQECRMTKCLIISPNWKSQSTLAGKTLYLYKFKSWNIFLYLK